jgi:hypothetical protein
LNLTVFMSTLDYLNHEQRDNLKIVHLTMYANAMAPKQQVFDIFATLVDSAKEYSQQNPGHVAAEDLGLVAAGKALSLDRYNKTETSDAEQDDEMEASE